MLGLPCSSNPNEIDDDQLKKAFRKAALKAHPDKGGSDDAFRKVKAASECIVRAKKHGIAHAADNIDSDDDENNFNDNGPGVHQVGPRRAPREPQESRRQPRATQAAQRGRVPKIRVATL